MINICDGKRLGYVCDIEVDVSCGQIRAIIVPGGLRGLGLLKGGDIVIPWENVKRIGRDIILVEVNDPPKC